MIESRRLAEVTIIPSPSPEYSVLDGYLLLANSTEMVYKVPPNTTLIEVLGPVGERPTWYGDGFCYAKLEPKPTWWIDGNIPLSKARKTMDKDELGMFYFPIDPEVEFTLHVGALGQESNCPVNGVRTYPFHV